MSKSRIGVYNNEVIKRIRQHLVGLEDDILSLDMMVGDKDLIAYIRKVDIERYKRTQGNNAGALVKIEIMIAENE